MEHLKSGEVPALVTNVELMHILSKRIDARKEQEQEDAKRNKSSKHTKSKKLRHRDYIEKTVFEYLSCSPCGEADLKRMPKLVSRLKGETIRGKSTEVSRRNNIIKAEDENIPLEKGVDQGDDSNIKQDSKDDDVNVDHQTPVQNFGLTDAETLQILNHMPTLPVEIHLMIEDLTSRLSDDDQNNLLRLISEYSGSSKS